MIERNVPPARARLRQVGDALLALTILVGVIAVLYALWNPDGEWTPTDWLLLLAGVSAASASLVSWWVGNESQEGPSVRPSRNETSEKGLAEDPSIGRDSERDRVDLETVLEHVPSGFVLMDRDRRILMASGNFERITGRTVEDLIGRHCTAQLWSEQICRGCPSERALQSGRTESEIVEVEGLDEQVGYFEHVSIPIRRDGVIDRVLEIVTDITDRKVLQDSLVRAEKLGAAGEMASVIAHEMRNAMTSVKMILQLIQESSGQPVEDDAIRVALDSVQRSESILGQLLRFASPAPLERTKVDVSTLLQEASSLVQTHLERRSIRFEIEAPNRPVSIWGDSEQLKTALLNLMLNAAQAVEGNGRVTLKARVMRVSRALRDLSPVGNHSPVGPVEEAPAIQAPLDRPYREIYLASGSEAMYFEVEDDGCGIPPERLSRVFDPFFTTKLNGTGLGLPLVRRIANDHGGIVRAENLDPGCRFTLVLPLRTIG